ncbi:hypothetical protein HOF40_02045 [Candidatus Parcubacteria bacterium]|nr:hypothetical protein [Candidatus Parcubacteria bacterium]MBT3948846.1 hypothetical protein [Candidatus Parcubacteria bacterium]
MIDTETKMHQIEALKMDFSRPMPEEYEKIIAGSSFIRDSEPYSKNFMYVWGRPPREGSSVEDFIKQLQDEDTDDDNEPDLFKKRRLFLKELIKDKKFIDLGSGDPSRSVAAPALAKVCNAEEYIGIDLGSTPEQSSDISIEVDKDGFRFSKIQADMLMAVTKYKKEGGNIFFLSGIESHPANLTNNEYTTTLIKEMSRLCKTGDAILSVGSDVEYFGVILEQNGFKEDMSVDLMNGRVFIKQ